MEKLKGTYASINLDNIIHNYKEVCKWVANDVVVTTVVKSDAYGHGEKNVVQALIENGVKIVCVSTIIEALRLRKNFQDIEIIILGYTPRTLLKKVAENNLIQTISTVEEAEMLNEISKTKVHIKVNTGMNRLGFDFNNAASIEKISKFKNLEICGIFTHLYSSDSADKTAVEIQFQRFRNLIAMLKSKDVNVGTKHVCNSGGIIDSRHMHLDMVREGIMLYGLYPSNKVSKEYIKLKECMEFKSYIASIGSVKKGEGIGYGHTFIAEKDMKVATINLGYSDGLFRNLSNNAEVIINDQRRKIVGRICMNMFMVDVTDMEDVSIEDEVIIFGKSENNYISIDEVASKAGTISYEIVCRTGYSVPRVYVKNNKIIEIENDFIVIK
ncbi:alanine racemase [Clostridium grantii]|uniref:Alanine racemase n=1 Tax=Clostridium grantii DSM 8605 TaxID=1121316 RepID=A0A1M5TR38_9CLOT|nr:alanine racemase [Clostridium grantii]SHH53169.1 alanine racemase [Clostridium grantii DSM 8605]